MTDHGINTSDVQPGADVAYEKKIAILNEALIDIGMNGFQWKIYAMTGLGKYLLLRKRNYTSR